MVRKNQTENPKSSIGRFTAGLAGRPRLVLGVTFVVAFIVTVIALRLDNWETNWATFSGLLATLWALALAITIYIITARDTDRIVDQFNTLAEQIGALLPDPEAQSGEARSEALARFSEYVNALREELPSIPIEDIVAIERPGSGPGNRPVLIVTQHGKRYSVYKGGRARTGFTVTRLPDEDK